MVQRAVNILDLEDLLISTNVQEGSADPCFLQVHSIEYRETSIDADHFQESTSTNVDYADEGFPTNLENQQGAFLTRSH